MRKISSMAGRIKLWSSSDFINFSKRSTDQQKLALLVAIKNGDLSGIATAFASAGVQITPQLSGSVFEKEQKNHLKHRRK